LATVGDLPEHFLLAMGLVLGLLFGSFLNVVIYRVPRGLSVLFPGSACPGCNTPIRPWQNIPVLSWVWLKGRAHCCGVPIPIRYPLVELLGGAVGLLVVMFRLNDPSLGLGHALMLLSTYLALGLGLIALTFIDLEFMILPDSLTLGGALLGIVSAPLRHRFTMLESSVWCVAGYLLIWLPFIWGYEKVRGIPGMGFGDAKLVALAGAWFGPAGLLFTLFGGAIQGTVAFVVTLLIRGKIEEPTAVTLERAELKAALENATPEERAELEQAWAEDPLAEEPDGSLATARIAFGPFLALALLELLFFEDLIFLAIEHTLFVA
jgi:leader peptidase (prepilin peptidase) / N-methyltransferase